MALQADRIPTYKRLEPTRRCAGFIAKLRGPAAEARVLSALCWSAVGKVQFNA